MEPKQTYGLFRCPTHGVLSEREGDEVLEGHDGTMFGRTPDGDPHTGKFYCGIYNCQAKAECLEPLDEVTLVEAARLDDAIVDELVEIVTGWTGDTGTDYMAVTVKVRELLGGVHA